MTPNEAAPLQHLVVKNALVAFSVVVVTVCVAAYCVSALAGKSSEPATASQSVMLLRHRLSRSMDGRRLGENKSTFYVTLTSTT